jgi:replicative DNA helicase
MTDDTLPPRDELAEQALLGAVLIDPDVIARVASIVKPDDFYQAKNGWVYEAALGLHATHSPVDVITVTSALERAGRLDDMGRGHLALLVRSCPTSYHAERYARDVADCAAKRRLIHTAQKIVDLAYSETPAGEAVDQAQGMLFQVAERRESDGLLPLRTVLDELYDRVDYLQKHGPDGVPTGFTKLDHMLGGLQKSDLIIVAGRPGMGKTALALTMMLNAAKKGYHAAMFSLEMSRQQLAQRLVSMQSDIDSSKLRLGKLSADDWIGFVDACGELSERYIYVDDTPAITPMALRSKARKLQAQKGLDLLIVDYISLMRPDMPINNKVQEVTYISGQLKALARELNIPVVALSQLNRNVELRQDKRPVIADLRESGSIEQDADAIFLLYRAAAYDENIDPGKRNLAECIVGKHRHGATGTVMLYFDGVHTRFADLAVREDDPWE